MRRRGRIFVSNVEHVYGNSDSDQNEKRDGSVKNHVRFHGVSMGRCMVVYSMDRDKIIDDLHAFDALRQSVALRREFAALPNSRVRREFARPTPQFTRQC